MNYPELTLGVMGGAQRNKSRNGSKTPFYLPFTTPLVTAPKNPTAGSI